MQLPCKSEKDYEKQKLKMARPVSPQPLKSDNFSSTLTSSRKSHYTHILGSSMADGKFRAGAHIHTHHLNEQSSSHKDANH
jgi:hypothetical protein